MAYNEEYITIKRSELEELKDFKERMGKAMDLQLGTSGSLSEDLNNPCRESELKEMYKELKQIKWADFLFWLNEQRMNRQTTKTIKKKAEEAIQTVLKNSQIEIGKIINDLRSTVQMTQDKKGNKVQKFYSSCINKLQMAVYFGDKGCQTFLKEDRDLLQVQDVLDPLLDASYKIGCLMALHNPPLLLDWENKGQETFPPVKIGSSAEFGQSMNKRQTEEVEQLKEQLATATREQTNLQRELRQMEEQNQYLNKRVHDTAKMEEQNQYLNKRVHDTAKCPLCCIL